MFGLAPDDGAASDGASARPPTPTLAMIQAEADDLAVMWGGTAEAKVKAADWVETRCLALGIGCGESAPSALRAPPPLKRGEDSAAVFVVDGDNSGAGQIFMGMASQWRVTTMSSMAGGIRIKEGLDYTALPVVAGALGIVLDKDNFEGVQELERLTLGLEAGASKRGKGR